MRQNYIYIQDFFLLVKSFSNLAKKKNPMANCKHLDDASYVLHELCKECLRK